MKNRKLNTVLTLLLVTTAILVNGQTITKVSNGESVKNVYATFEKLLKDSLNPNIAFDSTLAKETIDWLDLNIQGKSKGAVTGKAHFYSKIANIDGLNLSGIVQLTDKNIDRIKTGEWSYRFATEDGLPTSFYMTAIEREGVTYFVYAMN